MKVAETDELDDFMYLHADSRTGIERWLERMGRASWRNPNEMAREISNFDRVGGGRYVFDIYRNRYRLVADIDYRGGSVRVCIVGTHREYDRIDARTV